MREFFGAYRSLPTMVGLLWTSIGLWFIMPWDTFDSGPAYLTLSQIGNEGAIGLILLLVGLAVLFPAKLSLHFNRIRRLGLLAGLVAASIFLVAFGSANTAGLAIPLWSSIVVGCLWGYIQGSI